jgi:hypothetical protein
VPFKMLRERIPMLSAMTLDQLGARMRCDKCGKRPERYYPANQSDTGVSSKLLDVLVAPSMIRFRCSAVASSSPSRMRRRNGFRTGALLGDHRTSPNY